jgi:hypothetical protein
MSCRLWPEYCSASTRYTGAPLGAGSCAAWTSSRLHQMWLCVIRCTQLNPRIFQQRLDLAMKANAVARQLMLTPRHGAPQPLLGIRYEAQDQLSGHVPPQQPLGIREIGLAAPRGSVRLRLG